MSLYQSVDDYREAHHKQPGGTAARVQEVLDQLNGLGRRLDAVRFQMKVLPMRRPNRWPPQQKPISCWQVCLWPIKSCMAAPLQTGRGWPDEGGSKSYQGQTARRTATVINKLDAAGAIDCGRLVSVEYALGVTGHNAFAGTPKNPWNPAYICGGSSSGSGAVVAAGIVPAALGSDTGGSIRLPAAACGLVGIKPSHGLVSRAGVFALSNSLDTVGPLSRSVQDGAQIFAALTGYDGADNQSLHTAQADYLSGLEDGLGGIRLGLAEPYFLTGSDTEVADPVASCFEQCARAGAICCDIEIAGIEAGNPLNVLLIASEAAQIHKRVVLDSPDQLNDQTLMRVLTGIFTRDEDYQRLQAARAECIARTIDEVFEKVDMFMTPVWPLCCPPSRTVMWAPTRKPRP